MHDAEIAIKQGELILRLYELRREPVMRLARGYVGGAFSPHTAEEFVSIMIAGDQNASYVLQVDGYWDMAAGLVFHGALDSNLVYDTCPEMYFQFVKIRPFLQEFRRRSSLPELFQNLQKLVEGSEKGQARLNSMEEHLGFRPRPV